EERGYFRLTRPEVPEGQRYAYRLDGGPVRPDPASLWQPDGVHGPSAVVRPGRFAWSDGAWRGVRREDLVFYELHVGTFTSEGTFDAVIPRLRALRELGVAAVELLPVAQFPGPRNGGYHADGLRLDAVHAIFDFGARPILRAVKEVADDAGRRAGRTAHVIAESDLNDPRLLLPPERGGYGLDAQWSDDFHHAVHTQLTGE